MWLCHLCFTSRLGVTLPCGFHVGGHAATAVRPEEETFPLPGWGKSTVRNALPELREPEKPREGTLLCLWPPLVPTRRNRSPPGQGSCCGSRAGVTGVPHIPEILRFLSFSSGPVSRHTTLEKHLCLELGKRMCCEVGRLWAFSLVVSVVIYGRGYQKASWNHFSHLTGDGPKGDRRS